MTNEELIQQYLNDPQYATLNYTANTGYNRPVDEGGYTGYDSYGLNDLGLNVDRIYSGMEGNDLGGDAYMETPTYSGYKSQLTNPDQDGKYLLAEYDDAGNLVNITEETRDTGGWFGENIDWIAPALIGGFALAGAGGLGAFGSTAAADSGLGFAASNEMAGLAAAEAGFGGSATGLAGLEAGLVGGSGMLTPYLPVGETLGTGITPTTGAGTVGGGIAGTGQTLAEMAAATGLSESVLSSAIASGTLTELIDSVAGGLTPGSIDVLKDLGISDVGKLVDIPGAGGGGKQAAGSGINPLAFLTGGLSILGAKDIYNKTAAMGPDMLSKYNALGAQLQGQYGDISSGIRNDMGGLFDAARQQGMDAYGAASQIDLNNLRQQEFDIMQAMFADPRAAQAASVEARQIAQGRGGLQSFNQAYSADFTDPTTGQTYTVGANPADVAMYKAWANDDLNAYLQADKNALNRYSTLANLGNQASNTALGIQDTWNRPLMSGIDAFGRMGANGIQSYGLAQFKANDAYANMVAGLMGGVQNAASGSGGTQLNTALNKGVDALYSYGKDAVGNVWDSFTGLFS